MTRQQRRMAELISDHGGLAVRAFNENGASGSIAFLDDDDSLRQFF